MKMTQADMTALQYRKRGMIIVVLSAISATFANIVAYWAGAGELQAIAQACLYTSVIIQWRVIIAGNIRQGQENTKDETETCHALLNADTSKFRLYRFMTPQKRRWYINWLDKLRNQTYVHLWSYTYDEMLDSSRERYYSHIKYPVSDKQLFEMKLKGYIETNELSAFEDALVYLDKEEMIVEPEA